MPWLSVTVIMALMSPAICGLRVPLVRFSGVRDTVQQPNCLPCVSGSALVWHLMGPWQQGPGLGSTMDSGAQQP